jgi:predicted DNA binding CopG/RHH family protein
MKRIRLSNQEIEIDEIAQTIVNRKKDAVLNVRVNSRDLQGIKEKAQKLGVKYPPRCA